VKHPPGVVIPVDEGGYKEEVEVLGEVRARTLLFLVLPWATNHNSVSVTEHDNNTCTAECHRIIQPPHN